MIFSFSEKKNDEELIIDIIKPENGDKVSLVIKKGDRILSKLDGKAPQYETMLAKYNYAMIGNERNGFDSLFPYEFLDLSKVIGITNSLGNYFTYFNNPSFSVNSFISYMHDIEGFAFVDWDVVNKKNLGSQIIYATTSCEVEAGKTELMYNYEKGRISKISYVINDCQGTIYCLDSGFLNRGRTIFIKKIRSKVNEILIRRFPG